MDTQFYQVVQIFFNFLIMLAIRKPDKLCITILAILVTNKAEVLKISCIYPQMDMLSFNNPYSWSLL